MKLALTFLLTTTLMYMNLEKPFNPILGETFQGFIAGCPVYVEQICHHPPICAFILYGRGYRVIGNLETAAKMHANSIDGLNIGDVKVEFYNTKNTINLNQPAGQVMGILMGKRCFNLDGKAAGYDMKNNLFAEIIYNPDKKGMLSFSKKNTTDDFFRGAIY